jgi:hypothetical protein
MANSIIRSGIAPWAVAGCIAVRALAPGPLLAQERAAIEGLVVEAETFQPVASASVTIVGVGDEVRTGADGGFGFPEAPIGRALIRVKAKGYPTVVEELEVTPGVIFIPIFLPSAATVLDELTVTARRREQPRKPQAQTAADLLSLYIPELRLGPNYVQRRATPARIGIRGRNSIGGSGEPTILLDGTLLNGGIDALRQIPADQVKSIRLLKGATGAFLYGDADGVIEIRTQAGPTP